MPDWLSEHEALAWWFSGLTVLGVLLFAGTLLALPWLVARMPSDYFVREADPSRWRHPAWRVVWLIGKNVLGVLLLIAGVSMLVLPGQGLLTILIAVVLINFPGKRRFELWLVRRRFIRRTIDWLRARWGRAPLQLPADVHPKPGSPDLPDPPSPPESDVSDGPDRPGRR